MENLFHIHVFQIQDPVGYTSLSLTGESQIHAVTVNHNGAAHQCQLAFKEQTAYSLILHGQTDGTACKLVSFNPLAITKILL